jgi:hypothetical protein
LKVCFFFIYFIYLFYLVSYPNPCSLPPEWEERYHKIEEEKKRRKIEGRRKQAQLGEATLPKCIERKENEEDEEEKKDA